jgi:hypothetical protein
MRFVSIFVELLRTRPSALVWSAAIAQAVLWTLVPALFYAVPPGALPDVLAVGREFQFGTDLGPPLAFWLAEIAFAIGGLFAVYLLSQLCMVVTYWAVFALGRDIVGPAQAAMAVLLMFAISVFTVPTPEFGPGILALPLWALALLFYWRAVGGKRRLYWIAFAVVAGLLVFTTYASLVLLALLIGFTLATGRGRHSLTWPEPWIAGVVLLLILFPMLIWLDRIGWVPAPFSRTSLDVSSAGERMSAWIDLLGSLLLAHAGALVLVALALGLPYFRRGTVPVIERGPVDPDARHFIYFFALAPAAAMSLFAFLTNRPDTLVGPPLVVLSGLAIVMRAPERIQIAHQRFVGFAWSALLVIPPLLVALAIPLLPWTLGVDLRISQPGNEMGRFFAENFQRRTGRPLAIVAGDPRLASLIAVGAPSRPSLYRDAAPERTPWVTRLDIEEKGAVVVWPATDTRGLPPAAIRERFPDLVPEVPRAFERRFQGRLPLQRIGWAVIRPRPQLQPARQ